MDGVAEAAAIPANLASYFLYVFSFFYTRTAIHAHFFYKIRFEWPLQVVIFTRTMIFPLKVLRMIEKYFMQLSVMYSSTILRYTEFTLEQMM